MKELIARGRRVDREIEQRDQRAEVRREVSLTRVHGEKEGEGEKKKRREFH